MWKRKILIFACSLIFIFNEVTAQGKGSAEVHGNPSPNGFTASIEGLSESFQLELKRSKDSVLGSGIHILNLDVDESGNYIYNKWTPNEDELQKANDVYIDESNKAVLRVESPEPGSSNVNLNGIVSDSLISSDGNSHTLKPLSESHLDYIPLDRNFSSRIGTVRSTQPVNAIVELVIVCDKEFADVFGQNYQKILEYFTVFLWDINMRFKTLPSNTISFRVNGIILISSFAAQPFIESARASDGRATHGTILAKYADWLYTQRSSMPKYDVAPLVTNTALSSSSGGLAHLGGACWVDNENRRMLGSAIWNDVGDWATITTAAHELGHILGADHDDMPGFPGGCDQSGFIMMATRITENRRYYFSSCSDRQISKFVRSENASCLMRLDETATPAIDPSTTISKFVLMSDMCKTHLKSDKAFVFQEDTYNCKMIKCFVPAGGEGVYTIVMMPPVENAICGDFGRCFRGECRMDGIMFKNKGSGLCMVASSPFEFMAPARMIRCAKDPSPLDNLRATKVPEGFTFGSPYTLNGNQESGEKCLYTGNSEGDAIWTDKCSTENPWHVWEIRRLDDFGFLLVHKLTGRCAKPNSREENTYIQTFANCDANNPDMVWTNWV